MQTPPLTPHVPLTLVHSSDLHLGTDGPRAHDSLEAVLAAAQRAAADILLLAGDVFDHNRVKLAMLDEVARKLGDARMEVVILPGNHDCLVPDSVYRRGGLSEPGNVHVIGLDEETIAFPRLDFAVWGRAHRDYDDMRPLDGSPARSALRQVVTAHGHWHGDGTAPGRSWLISNDELGGLDADYVALGHVDRHSLFETNGIPVSYSGSPDLARSVNVVRWSDGGAPHIERVPLAPPPEA